MATIRQGNNQFKISAINAIKLLLGFTVLLPPAIPHTIQSPPPPSGINPPPKDIK